MTSTNPRPPQIPFPELAGHWTITVVLDTEGVIRASLGRLDLVTRKMRWTTIGERVPVVRPILAELPLFVNASEAAVLSAAARLQLG